MYEGILLSEGFSLSKHDIMVFDFQLLLLRKNTVIPDIFAASLNVLDRKYNRKVLLH